MLNIKLKVNYIMRAARMRMRWDEESGSDEEEEVEPNTLKSITLTEESIKEQFYSTETLIINLNESETFDSCLQASGEQEASEFIHDLENINFSKRSKKRHSSAHDDDSDDKHYHFDNDGHVQ